MKNTTYQPWFTLTFRHAYFGEKQFPAQVVPSAQTQAFFRQWNILIRHDEPVTWLFLKEVNGRIPEMVEADVPLLHFDLCPAAPLFHYVSNEISPDAAFTVTNPHTPRIWRQLAIDLSRLFSQLPTEIQISIPARQVYFEYILIPRGQEPEAKIRCTEKRSQIRFDDPEKISLPGIPVAYRILSAQPVELRLENNYTFQLWKVMETGEQLLAQQSPVPQPSQPSIIDPHKAITAYFYY